MSFYRKIGKPVFDLSMALVLSVLLLPIFLLVAIVVRGVLGAPVFFLQQRPGYLAQPFYLIKFRTMRNAVDENGDPLPDAERLSSIGSVLRKYSLDEIPQLINILKGEMSLVGPRPLLMEYLPLYSAEQRRRHQVKPGVTGLAQVNGRNLVDWDKRFALDIWYVDNLSLWLDLKIIALTLLKTIKAEGITQIGSVTMEKFRGGAHE